MVQIDSGRYRVLKANHEKAVEVFKVILEHQHAHPEIFYYSRSRTFFMDAPDNPDEEIWMFIDEYDDREKYWSSLMKALTVDSETDEKRQSSLKFMIPGTELKGHEIWTEIEDLRVEFKDRPLK